MANLRQGIQALSKSVTASAAAAELIAAVSGQYIYITDLVISVGATAGAVKIATDGSSGTILVGDLNFAVNSSIAVNLTTPLKGGLGKNIHLVITTAAPVTVLATYYTASK